MNSAAAHSDSGAPRRRPAPWPRAEARLCNISPGAVPELLAGNPLFKGLTGHELVQVSAVLERRAVPSGGYVFHAGDKSEELFIIVRGEVEIIKEATETGRRHRITTLARGDSFGEGALLDGKVRSVSVRALEDCELLSLRAAQLNAPGGALAERIRLNLGEQVSQNLRRLGDATARLRQQHASDAGARATVELFVATTLAAVCAYVFLLQVALRFVHGKAATLALTIPSFLFFILLFFRAAQRSGQPLANYGVTAKNWKRAVLEAAICSVPIMLLAVFAKWTLIAFLPGMQNEPLFAVTGNGAFEHAATWAEVAAYVALSPFQEFVVRGAIQGAFEDFLTGRRRLLKAILGANVIYSMLHLYMSVLFSVMVFIPGLVWGWLYSRHRTLAGVSLSHALCGVFGFFVVGFDGLIQMYG